MLKAIVAAAACGALVQAPAAPRSDWIQLFNGKNLDGWDVKITGRAKPEGKLPFELPSSMAAVEAQRSDVPHDSNRPLHRFGFGLRY